MHSSIISGVIILCIGLWKLESARLRPRRRSPVPQGVTASQPSCLYRRLPKPSFLGSLALAKTTAFDCLFRHAAWNFLRGWLAVECRCCLIASAKKCLTITVTAADAAGVPAGADRYRSQFAH